MFVIDIWLAVWALVCTEMNSTSNTYYGSRNLVCFVLNHVPTRWTYFTTDRGTMMGWKATCYVYISFRLSLHKGHGYIISYALTCFLNCKRHASL